MRKEFSVLISSLKFSSLEMSSNSCLAIKTENIKKKIDKAVMNTRQNPTSLLVLMLLIHLRAHFIMNINKRSMKKFFNPKAHFSLLTQLRIPRTF